MSTATAVLAFDTLRARYRLTAQLVTVSAVRVGAGKATDISASDAPIMRDGRGRPFLPGSSLKGALRAGLERVLRAIDAAELKTCDPLDRKLSCSAKLQELKKQRQEQGDRDNAELQLDQIEAGLCVVCALFGSSFFAGRLLVRDLPAAGDADVFPEVRDGVGLDRDLRKAAYGIKYDFECLSPGTAFGLELRLENPTPTHLALALKALELLHEGHILLGGLTSRGLGRVELRDAKIERTDAAALLTGAGWSACDYDAEQAQAGERLAKLARQRGE